MLFLLSLSQNIVGHSMVLSVMAAAFAICSVVTLGGLLKEKML